MEIPLTQGRVALVDSDDYERVSQFKWHAKRDRNTFYAASSMGGKSKPISMHRFILGLERGNPMQVDHINHNGLDNRRSNMRLVTTSENLRNRKNPARGWYYVPWNSKKKPYRVIKHKKHIGFFATQEEAEEAYKNAN